MGNVAQIISTIHLGEAQPWVHPTTARVCRNYMINHVRQMERRLTWYTLTQSNDHKSDSRENNVTTVPGPPCHVVSSNPCAGNYGIIDPCCDQEGDTVDPQWQCPQSKPTCVDYVYNDHWGFCEKKVLLN